MTFYRPLPPYMSHKSNMMEVLWMCRINAVWNLKTWWMNNRPVDWKDTLITWGLMSTIVAILGSMVVMAIWGLMVTECNL